MTIAYRCVSTAAQLPCAFTGTAKFSGSLRSLRWGSALACTIFPSQSAAGAPAHA